MLKSIILSLTATIFCSEYSFASEIPATSNDAMVSVNSIVEKDPEQILFESSVHLLKEINNQLSKLKTSEGKNEDGFSLHNIYTLDTPISIQGYKIQSFTFKMNQKKLHDDLSSFHNMVERYKIYTDSLKNGTPFEGKVTITQIINYTPIAMVLQITIEQQYAKLLDHKAVINLISLRNGGVPFLNLDWKERY